MTRKDLEEQALAYVRRVYGDDMIITAGPEGLADLVMPAVVHELREMRRCGALPMLAEASFSFDLGKLIGGTDGHK